MGVCVTVIQQRVHQNEFEHLYTNEWQALTLALAVLATVVAVSLLMVMGVATVVPCPDDGGCRGGEFGAITCYYPILGSMAL